MLDDQPVVCRIIQRRARDLEAIAAIDEHGNGMIWVPESPGLQVVVGEMMSPKARYGVYPPEQLPSPWSLEVRSTKPRNEA